MASKGFELLFEPLAYGARSSLCLKNQEKSKNVSIRANKSSHTCTVKLLR
jgi:hypothetical protein